MADVWSVRNVLIIIIIQNEPIESITIFQLIGILVAITVISVHRHESTLNMRHRLTECNKFVEYFAKWHPHVARWCIPTEFIVERKDDVEQIKVGNERDDLRRC